jgi:hypothetical protein
MVSGKRLDEFLSPVHLRSSEECIGRYEGIKHQGDGDFLRMNINNDSIVLVISRNTIHSIRESCSIGDRIAVLNLDSDRELFRVIEQNGGKHDNSKATEQQTINTVVA